MTNNKDMGEVVDLFGFHGFKFNSLLAARDKLTALGYVPCEYGGVGDSPPWEGWERWVTLDDGDEEIFATIRFKMGEVAYLDFEERVMTHEEEDEAAFELGLI